MIAHSDVRGRGAGAVRGCTFEAAPAAAEELRGMFTGAYTDGLAGLEKALAAR